MAIKVKAIEKPDGGYNINFEDVDNSGDLSRVISALAKKNVNKPGYELIELLDEIVEQNIKLDVSEGTQSIKETWIK